VLEENTAAANRRVATRARCSLYSDGFRWCLLGGEPGFLMSLLLVPGLLWLGVSYFRKTERTLSDFM
jgi:hypothetical protein